MQRSRSIPTCLGLSSILWPGTCLLLRPVRRRSRRDNGLLGATPKADCRWTASQLSIFNLGRGGFEAAASPLGKAEAAVSYLRRGEALPVPVHGDVGGSRVWRPRVPGAGR